MRITFFDGAKLRTIRGKFAKKCPPTCEFNKSFDNVLSFTTPKNSNFTVSESRVRDDNGTWTLIDDCAKKFNKLNLFKIFLFNRRKSPSRVIFNINKYI